MQITVVNTMNQFSPSLMNRLKDKGIDPQAVPGFIRSLTHVLSVYPFISLREVSRIMQYLGWQDAELDYHTFQLVIADLKPHQVSGLNLKNPSIVH